MREIGWDVYSYINRSFRFSPFAILQLSNHFIEIPHNDFVRMFYETIFTAGTENRSRRFIQFAYIKLSYIIAIFFPSLALSRSPLSESIRRLSASASWESHPRALARTLLLKKIISVFPDFFAVSMIFSLIFIWIQILKSRKSRIFCNRSLPVVINHKSPFRKAGTGLNVLWQVRQSEQDYGRAIPDLLITYNNR